MSPSFHQLVLILAVACLAPLAGAVEAGGQRAGGPCPDGRPLSGDLGFDQVQCVGGACSLFRRSDDGGYEHELTVEPRLWEIRGGGPAAGILEEGDVLVAVEGRLITTREAGRRLANLEPGQPVELRLRRDGVERSVSITPVAGCGPGRLVSTSDPDYRGGKHGEKDGGKGKRG